MRQKRPSSPLEESQRKWKKEGTLGKLLGDDQLIKEAEKTMKKIQKAAESIEEQTPITVLGTIVGIFF
jgi:phospholipid/cholesterol/gamma-HCH transport system substrate-binding protein